MKVIALSIAVMLVAICLVGCNEAGNEVEQRNTCVNNLRILDSAKQQWALESSVSDDTHVSAGDIDDYVYGNVKSIQCPVGGQYNINPTGEKPECSYPGHSLLSF